MNYYSFHIGDYRGATAHLSNEEDLCYRRLLDMYYDTQSPIPLDTHWVSRRLRVGLEVLENVLRDFFVSKEDGWHNKKADLVVAEYIATTEKNRANGKKGGRPASNKTKHENPVGSQSVPSGNRMATVSEGNQEPITNNQEPYINPPSPLAGGKVPPSPRKRGKAARAAGQAQVDWLAGLPVELDVPEFRQRWLEWVEYRRALNKPVNPASLPAAFRQAAKLGLREFLEKSDRAMANGWQGFDHPSTEIHNTAKHDHRAEKRSREFPECIQVRDIVG